MTEHQVGEYTVGLTAVERFLHALPQGGIVDEVEDIDASADVVQLPERLLGLVLTGIGTQFAHDRRLGHIFLHKGCQDTLDIRLCIMRGRPCFSRKLAVSTACGGLAPALPGFKA